MAEPLAPEVYVTNLNKRFTGVSSTARAVLQQHLRRYHCALVGVGLPALPEPVTVRAALRLSRQRPAGRPFAIWHVRRNIEMQWAIFARDVLRLPIRIVFTSAAKRRHSAWPRFLISRMDRIIATSPEAAEHVGRHHAVIPHGVNTEQFQPSADFLGHWQSTGLPGAYGIANVGRVRPEKGTDVFVDAMIAALPKLEGATAVIIGLTKSAEQPFRNELQSRIDASGLSDRFVFTGALAPDQLVKTLNGCRLLCAVPQYEGYGMTALEGMACGLPVVATATGHFAEAVGNAGSGDQAGLILPVGDVRGIADAVVRILSDDAEHARMSANARARVTALFGIGREADAIATVYEELWAKG